MKLCQQTGGFELPFLEERNTTTNQVYFGNIDNVDKYIHKDDIIFTL